MSKGTQLKSKIRSASLARRLEKSIYKDLTNAKGPNFRSKLFRDPDFQTRFIRFFSRIKLQFMYLERGRIIRGPYRGSLKPGSLRNWLTAASDDSKLHDYRLTGYDFAAVRRHLTNRMFGSSAEDHRLVLQWKDLYLVKKLFSAGLVIVPPDVCHKVVAFHQHLDIYILKEGASYPRNGGAGYRKGEMPETSISFLRSVVRPFMERRIPGGSKYILIAPSPCIFMHEIIYNA